MFHVQPNEALSYPIFWVQPFLEDQSHSGPCSSEDSTFPAGSASASTHFSHLLQCSPCKNLGSNAYLST